MQQLGFTLADLPAGLQTSQSRGKRHDIVQLGGENPAAGLNGESLFLFASDQQDADALSANPLLAHLPAVQHKRVYATGRRDVPPRLLQRHPRVAASVGTVWLIPLGWQ